MNSPAQDESQARGVVAIVVSVVLAIPCLLIFAGLCGAGYVWFQERAKTAAQADEHASQIAELQAELDAIHQGQQQLQKESIGEQNKLLTTLEEKKQSHKQIKVGYFAFETPKPFVPHTRQSKPSAYREPIATETWTGVLRTSET